jgi:hypothetical protein
MEWFWMLQDWPLVQMNGGPETPGGVSGRGLEANEDRKASSELLKVEESELVEGVILAWLDRHREE